MKDAPAGHFLTPGVHHASAEAVPPDHEYLETPMSEVDRLIHGGTCCALCGGVRYAHPKVAVAVKMSKRAELRMNLLSMKSMLEEVEEKARVCYLETVQMLADIDEEARSNGDDIGG
jgi:hypothetical protein